MNEQELKDKIIAVLKESRKKWEIITPSIGILDEPRVDIEIGKLADALIAAEIGDVKEAEHRAKFSERALHCLARSFAEAMCKYGDDTHYLADGFIQDAYSQAEKELEEEKNERL